jgi:hypothetical protein
MAGHGRQRRPTQTQRVLRALMDRGGLGVDATGFLLPATYDGMAPITRVAARVFELRQLGHDITVVGERHGCAIYALAGSEREMLDVARRQPEYAHVVALELSAMPGWDAMVAEARKVLAA